MEPVAIIVIFITLIALFIPNNNEEPLASKLFQSSLNARGEYSKMYDYYYGTKSCKYPKYLNEHKVISGVKSLDYDKLYKVILKTNYEINPKKLNEALDWIDKNENIIKTGISFRINKNFIISSKDKQIQEALYKLDQEEIDSNAKDALRVDVSQYLDGYAYKLSASSRFRYNIRLHTNIQITKNSYFKVNISGIVQQYGIFSNPQKITNKTIIL